jgi:putative endonuclease
VYIGVTSNLAARDYIHKSGTVEGFTKRYDCKLLVWYELHETMESAILCEKQLKAGSRAKKLTLIEKNNPEWRDLSPDLF